MAYRIPVILCLLAMVALSLCSALSLFRSPIAVSAFGIIKASSAEDITKYATFLKTETTRDRSSCLPSAHVVLRKINDMNDGTLVSFIAFDFQGRVSGCAELLKVRDRRLLFQSDAYYLQNVCTARAHRRRGVADRLLQEVKSVVTHTHRPLVLEVDRTNQAAIALYKKHGFKMLGRNFYSGRLQMVLRETSVRGEV
ncbi:acyl-CoA N-acyltransferase [Ochromonadaceae sp. CCMP2298]|nr:acyl-CoA N-acyltransferase [Ochromonadaceae sp. CCMP2298]